MITDQLKKLTHQMRLFGIHETMERRAAEATANDLSPLEFLRLLLEDEIASRRERVAKSLVTRAKFKHSADLEDWDETFERGLTKARLKELYSLGFFHKQENLISCRQTGVGKSHLAIALGRRACQALHECGHPPQQPFH